MDQQKLEVPKMRCMIFVLILAVPFLLFADQPYVPKENEEIYGSWVNTEYSGAVTEEQKIVIHPDGCELYSMAAFEIHGGTDKHIIIDKWTDSEGNIWYKRHFKTNYGPWVDLAKISKDGKTLECMVSFITSRFPTKIDPNHKDYRIYYRQK